ncbi:MAG TPA: hypothetical protein VES88_12125 [Gemmatimonadaceae bacterium]|nr:hypothetical protein [Gemmatimonadaceae bacterium]
MAGEPWDPVERDRRYASAKRDGLTRLLTEGDSWFDYPPHPNIVDWLEAEGQWAIKRLEKSGDTVENVASSTNLAVLSRIVLPCSFMSAVSAPAQLAVVGQTNGPRVTVVDVSSIALTSFPFRLSSSAHRLRSPVCSVLAQTSSPKSPSITNTSARSCS